MKTRRLIVALTAGATLSVGCGKTGDSVKTPDPTPPTQQPDTVPEIPPAGNPPPPPTPTQPAALPAFDDVESGHPMGATNPPAPQLIVDYAGRCYKRWVDPRRADPDALEVCAGAECGTAVQCNESGKKLHADWLASQSELPEWAAVASGHPEGATNPPRPVSIVSNNGTCWKDWESGMIKPTPETDDRLVANCTTETCGTQVQCTPDQILQLTTGKPGPK